MAEFRNLRTGQPIVTSDPAEIASLQNNDMWEVVATDERIDVQVPTSTGTASRRVRIEDLSGLENAVPLTNSQAARMDGEAREQRRIEDLQNMGGTAAAVAFGDNLSFGLTSAAADFIDPGAADMIREIQDQNQLATGGGALLGLVGGAVGGGATRLGALGRLLRGSSGGLGVAAGAAARRAVGSRLGSTAGRVADVIAQEGVMAAQITATDLAQNRPIVAETIFADGAVGVGLGLGFEALLGAGGRIGRRAALAAEATDGAAIASGTRRYADQSADLVSQMNPEQAREWMSDLGEVTADGNLAGRATEAVARRGMSADAPRLAQLARSPEARRALSASEAQITDNVARIADRIQALDAADNIAGAASRSLDNRIKDFRAPLSEISAESVVAMQQAARTEMTDAANKLMQLNAKGVGREILDQVERLTATSAGDLMSQAASVRGVMGTIRKGAGNMGAEAQAALADAYAAVNNRLLHNDQVFGQFSAAQKVIDAEISTLASAKKATGMFGKSGRKTFRQRVEATLRDASKEAADEHAAQLADLAVSYRSAGERIGGKEGAALVREANEILAEMKPILQDLRLRSEANQMLSSEIRRTGFSSNVAGIGGAAALGLVGGPAAAGLGLLAGGVVKGLVRPAAFTEFNVRMAGMAERVMGRRQEFAGRMRTWLRTGERPTFPRRAARGGIMSLYPFESDSPKEREQAFTQMTLALLERNDLNRLQNEITASIEPLVEVDPGLAAPASQTLATAHQHLVMNLPPIQFDPLFPQHPTALPSQGEIDAFMRRVAAIDDPYSILDRFLEGTLDTEEVDSVRTVFPEIYNTMTMDILEVLTEGTAPEAVPYEVRLHVSTMFGIPTDDSFTEEYTLAVMNQGAQTQAQHQAQFSPSSLPQGSVSSVTQIATQNQRLSQ